MVHDLVSFEVEAQASIVGNIGLYSYGTALLAYFMLVILVAIALLAAAPAFASGFGFYEQSAKASGQAGAWVARADDAAVAAALEQPHRRGEPQHHAIA